MPVFGEDHAPRRSRVASLADPHAVLPAARVGIDHRWIDNHRAGAAHAQGADSVRSVITVIADGGVRIRAAGDAHAVRTDARAANAYAIRTNARAARAAHAIR